MRSLRSRLFELYLKRRTSRGRGATLAERRQWLDAMSGRLPLPRGMDVERLTVAGRPSEWLRPRGGDARRAVLYLHGGAYTAGSLASHRALAAGVAVASACPVLLLDYRLAPEHPFPAALDDATAAFEWLCSSTVGLAPGCVAVVGDSAGGGLSVATALKLRDERRPLPGCVVALSPWMDLEVSGESVTSRASVDPFFPLPDGLRESGRMYAAETSLRHPYVSPVHAELHGLPPLYLQVGDHEILLSDSETVARGARAAGTDVTLEVWPGMWHVWQALTRYVPEARRAMNQVGAFVRARLG
ncbi:alpha/beta hydrolase [Pyxidicoccus parkwayensis]|uniref:Alpha/beta hydrolase n=1 Tax=Pyxidicoccus parkwayensis TaxID=2813578 RepID=A0ABX7P720_9BACT|nr:alpha/beta hydrolase [Pyxidicoccus parkwaysis]QSQ26258.1 alpha/beta hydrolase [Pyxidicoccus parkwaysis]